MTNKELKKLRIGNKILCYACGKLKATFVKQIQTITDGNTTQISVKTDLGDFFIKSNDIVTILYEPIPTHDITKPKSF